MDYSKANETLKMFGGYFQKMMEGLSDWAENMAKSDKEEKKDQTFDNYDVVEACHRLKTDDTL